jgi:fructosamine-3-kinase
VSLQEALGRALSQNVVRMQPMAGGDIHRAFRAELDDGSVVFVKSNDRSDTALFAAESKGLSWLAEPGILRVPQVLAVSSGDGNSPGFLALEFITRGKPARDFDEQLGRGLAALHAVGAPRLGHAEDNFIGTLPQDNRPVDGDTWAEFYRLRRLQPQWQRMVDAGLTDLAGRNAYEAMCKRLPELCGPQEPPARLHGDLWAGNHLCDESGAPVIFDPAVHGGHREVDLAMMRLFGGFGSRVYASYREAAPLSEGAHERIELFQLYPLMVHANLFGGGYAEQVAAIIRRYA